MKKIIVTVLLTLLTISISYAQDTKKVNYKYAVNTNTFWRNWYVQTALDMSLQNPYGHNFKDVFPNGKTFGLVGAVGKWFTPELGLRARVNWENGIRLFENHHAAWLAPFYQEGVNIDRGGYMSVVGDIQLDIHNLLYGYDADRRWNLQVFPRAGAVYNFGVSKGSPLIGFGIGNTYRIDDRWRVYLDAAYNMVSSGFTGVEKSTGTGKNSNGYFDINLGVQLDLGKNTFDQVKKTKVPNRKVTVMSPSFWSNWYVQAGLDMSLQNPYGYNFSKVFPKGKTFGMNVATGKWFSPEVSLRLRVNWENGCPLMKNPDLEWVAPAGRNGINMDKGGYLAVYGDVPLSISNIFSGYKEGRKWNVLAFPRAGIINNLAIGNNSPMVGVGGGCVYRLNKKLGFYADMAYQMTTSDFMGDVSGTGMTVSSGSNGLFDFHVGIQFDLGKSSCDDFNRED
jgi:hypothetical protein